MNCFTKAVASSGEPAASSSGPRRASGVVLLFPKNIRVGIPVIFSSGSVLHRDWRAERGKSMTER